MASAAESHLLRLDAPADELAKLRELLRWLVRDKLAMFDALFAPNAPPATVQIPPGIEHLLRAFGLISGTTQALVTLPIRRKGDRFYVMAAGATGEYRQDVWPETDALLAQLDGAPPGRLLDMGTGCGILAIEGVVRGHTVIATDLYANTLALAAFNARLNGITERLEFRQGNLFEPVAGETFDLVLTAPHYTKVADQLRLEALRTAAPLSTPHGRVVIATFCEWDQGEELAMTQTVLAEQARAGFDVDVSPMPQELKQQWFTVATTDDPIAGLPSRHRFLVTITRATGPGTVTVTMPAADAIVEQRYAHLRHLTVGEVWPSRPRTVRRLPMFAVVEEAADLARLEELVTAIRTGIVTLDGELPIGMLDACRFGKRPCVPADIMISAAGAVLDRHGDVRPCTHGEVVATWTASYAELTEILQTRAAALRARRGCEACTARDVCSQCMFPHVLDEDAYCTTLRRWADVIPTLLRVFAILGALDEPTPPLRIKLRCTVPLLVARRRPTQTEEAPPDLDRALASLRSKWTATETAITIDGDARPSLFWWEPGGMRGRPVHPIVAAIGELAADGVSGGQLLAYLRAEQFPLQDLAQIFEVFRDLYAPPEP